MVVNLAINIPFFIGLFTAVYDTKCNNLITGNFSGSTSFNFASDCGMTDFTLLLFYQNSNFYFYNGTMITKVNTADGLILQSVYLNQVTLLSSFSPPVSLIAFYISDLPFSGMINLLGKMTFTMSSLDKDGCLSGTLLRINPNDVLVVSSYPWNFTIGMTSLQPVLSSFASALGASSGVASNAANAPNTITCKGYAAGLYYNYAQVDCDLNGVVATMSSETQDKLNALNNNINGQIGQVSNFIGTLQTFRDQTQTDLNKILANDVANTARLASVQNGFNDLANWFSVLPGKISKNINSVGLKLSHRIDILSFEVLNQKIWDWLSRSMEMWTNNKRLTICDSSSSSNPMGFIARGPMIDWTTSTLVLGNVTKSLTTIFDYMNQTQYSNNLRDIFLNKTLIIMQDGTIMLGNIALGTLKDLQTVVGIISGLGFTISKSAFRIAIVVLSSLMGLIYIITGIVGLVIKCKIKRSYSCDLQFFLLMGVVIIGCLETIKGILGYFA